MVKDCAVIVGVLLMGAVSLVGPTSSTTEECHDCQKISDTQTQENKPILSHETKEELLQRVVVLNTGCTSAYQLLTVKVPTNLFEQVREKVVLISRVLEQHVPQNDQKLLMTFIQEVVLSNEEIVSGRILWIGNGSMQQPEYYLMINDKTIDGLELNRTISYNYVLENDAPWLIKAEEISKWTDPYYSCYGHKWLLSFTIFMVQNSSETEDRIAGVVSVDIDITDMDINQCDAILVDANISEWQIDDFLGTHKCDDRTSECLFTPGFGWTIGAYKCACRKGYYSEMGSQIFNGSMVEVAFKEKLDAKSSRYDSLYVCKKCQPGCDECLRDTPCLSTYNWVFRISLLTISVICICLTLILSAYVYQYRKLKVFKVASPIFLCITLLGCIIMYCEMAAIFPVLDIYSCIATKWTRHMGFCITYSALLLKTWRVSLTYRVKSAHKLKLTDKQLLQWLFPILLVMAIYLGTWTISSPPVAVYIKDWHQLKFKQCDYNWWDHSLAIGEFLFLLWGIKVCYNVRNAESVFNEAKHISWAVHSITVINIIMILIHLVIFPNAGPDIKYLFGFIRTQMSTTITIILIFGPKFYRVITGQGDTWDSRARARGVTASFSLNGLGPVYEEPHDLCVENEELKEEVQKLASQIEFMKIVHMEVNNRHIKSKHGGFFSQPSNNQSPVIKNIYMKFESTDSPGSRISPAAELVSENV